MTAMNVRDRLTMISMASAVKSSYITYIFPLFMLSRVFSSTEISGKDIFAVFCQQ